VAGTTRIHLIHSSSSRSSLVMDLLLFEKVM
jgi:hypothetical protein